MANVVRRYRFASADTQDQIDRVLPLGAQLVAMADAQPYIEVDLTIDSAGTADLDAVMDSRGWTFVVEAPASPLGVKSMPFHMRQIAGNGDVPRLSITAGGNQSISFTTPEDFGTLVSVDIMGCPWGVDAVNNTLALTGYYGVGGESYIEHVNNVNVLYSSLAYDLVKVDLGSALAGVTQPYTSCAINIENTDLGNDFRIVLGGFLRYQPKVMV